MIQKHDIQQIKNHNMDLDLTFDCPLYAEDINRILNEKRNVLEIRTL